MTRAANVRSLGNTPSERRSRRAPFAWTRPRRAGGRSIDQRVDCPGHARLAAHSARKAAVGVIPQGQAQDRDRAARGAALGGPPGDPRRSGQPRTLKTICVGLTNRSATTSIASVVHMYTTAMASTACAGRMPAPKIAA